MVARVWEQEQLLRTLGAVLCSTWFNHEGLRVNVSSSDELLARQTRRRVQGAAAEDVVILMAAVCEDGAEQGPSST